MLGNLLYRNELAVCCHIISMSRDPNNILVPLFLFIACFSCRLEKVVPLYNVCDNVEKPSEVEKML